MNQLLQQLHAKFCQELNQLWLEAVRGNEGSHYNKERFTPFIAYLQEARHAGYLFVAETNPLFVLDIHPQGTEPDAILGAYPGWKDVTLLQSILDTSKQNDWKNLTPHYEALRNKMLTDVVTTCAMDYVRRYGPFFTRTATDTIYAFMYSGVVAHDMSLIAFLHGMRSSNPSVA